MKPLPRLAQFSRSNCALLDDIDGDGMVDCFLGQNFYGAQPEIGHFDMGSSLFLKGLGNGEFESVLPLQSGIQIPGAVMSLKAVDLNGDGRKEIIFGVNRSRIRVFSLLPQ
jgi:hypothetical protein